MNQAQCTNPECGYKWTLDFEEPTPEDSELRYQTYKKQALGMRCPKCMREKRETSYQTIEIGEHNADEPWAHV